MNNNTWKKSCICVVAVVTICGFGRAQTFSPLYNFNWVDGALPLYGSLAQGTDGNLYGNTAGGGSDVGCGESEGCGTSFRITPDGELTTLHIFCAQRACLDGANPMSSLTLAGDGKFFGTTNSNLSAGGTVFKISASGKLTTLHTFSGSDGETPYAGLIQADDGQLYGTTYYGGINNFGTVFKISPRGAFTKLHDFDVRDGQYPVSGLTQGKGGSFYGSTYNGGTNDHGTIFRVSATGAFKVLYNFCSERDCVDGGNPAATLLFASDGNLYGGTTYGGANGYGTIFELSPSDGTVKILHAFVQSDGEGMNGALLQATDGNLYGTSIGGGIGIYGTIFRMSLDGTYTTLHSFDGNDGFDPIGTFAEHTDGLLYGTTSYGGFYGYGTIFALDVGLDPFVAFVRGAGRVGYSNYILGQGLTGTTSVSLNGMQVSFTVVSDTSIKATVPAGATTGFATVTTPSDTLTSNVPFRVLPQLLSFDPPSGPPGTQVTIMGVSLTQTLGVGFGDRVQAQFTVNSDTSVTTTVPQGAKTGKIGIETKGGVAISQGTFEVTE